VRLWIDTDIGDNPDDAVALACASAHPDVELVGVSATGGRTEWRAAIARSFVAVHVVPGEHPDELAERLVVAKPDAVLAIGPLTNIAQLVVLGVPLPPVTVMGGLLEPLRHRGRLRRVESNFSRDPAAASVVVESTDATIVPLDVTVAMRMSASAVDALVAADRRLAPPFERWNAEQQGEPVVLHDPLALLVALGEPFATTEPRVLIADATDGTLRESKAGRAHAVVTGVDAPAAIDRVLGLLQERLG
jgi:inosine-uridine nucleoside N-ribohydrolase